MFLTIDPNVEIAQNDPVRVADSMVESLDLKDFRKLYKEKGRCAYDPKMMLKIIIYSNHLLLHEQRLLLPQDTRSSTRSLTVTDNCRRLRWLTPDMALRNPTASWTRQGWKHTSSTTVSISSSVRVTDPIHSITTTSTIKILKKPSPENIQSSRG